MEMNQMVFLDTNQMTLSGTISSTTPSSNITMDSKPSCSKVRKAYTMTKSRESWTQEEHDKFVEAIQLFDRDWKKIEAFVGSKSVVQIRSHAQKYFLKIQKNGTGQHVPPPRPKRKAAHPYPQKASKIAKMVPRISHNFQPSGDVLDGGYIRFPESMSLPRSNYEMDIISTPIMTQNCCSSSSIESNQWGGPISETNGHGTVKFLETPRMLPDFAQVYRYIGSVFDPNENDHLQKLKSMDSINVETVLLLMKNLTVNLTSPEFENYKKMLSSYDDAEKVKPCGFHHIPTQENAISLM